MPITYEVPGRKVVSFNRSCSGIHSTTIPLTSRLPRLEWRVLLLIFYISEPSLYTGQPYFIHYRQNHFPVHHGIYIFAKLTKSVVVRTPSFPAPSSTTSKQVRVSPSLRDRAGELSGTEQTANLNLRFRALGLPIRRQHKIKVVVRS